MTIKSVTSPKPGKHAITFVFICVLLDMMGTGLIMPALPQLIQQVSGEGLSASSMWSGWLFFAYGGMQFLFSPLIGNLSDAYGRRPVLLLSLLGMAADYVLMAFAPTLAWLFIGRLASGFCGASYTTANALISDITAPENRAKAFGLMGAAFGIGFVIGPAIGGIAGEYGPRVPFFVAAALSAINLVYGYVVLPETLPREKRRPLSLARANPVGALKVFMQYPNVIPACIVEFFYYLSTSVYPAIWAFWGIARFGWSEIVIGLTLSAFGLFAAVVQGVLTGPVVKRFGEWNAVLIGLVATAIAAIGYGLAPGFITVLVLLVIHAPEGFIYPALTAMMSKQAPEDAQGELQGGVASLQNIAMLIGTVFFAQVFGYFTRPEAVISSPNVAFFISGLMGVGLLVYFVLCVPKPSRQAPGQ